MFINNSLETLLKVFLCLDYHDNVMTHLVWLQVKSWVSWWCMMVSSPCSCPGLGIGPGECQTWEMESHQCPGHGTESQMSLAVSRGTLSPQAVRRVTLGTGSLLRTWLVWWHTLTWCHHLSQCVYRRKIFCSPEVIPLSEGREAGYQDALNPPNNNQEALTCSHSFSIELFHFCCQGLS